ncbi:MAG TPA: hypothetical protein VFF53_07540 [Geobacteraceae bacterium]|nr:hypothetical protein [Geobacteraceae bacterium]
MKKNSTDIRRTDIDLCFKALGLSTDASPAQVDKAYDAFMQRCKRQLLSADPGKRERTRSDMDLISDIHFRIKKSVTYADRLKMMGAQGGDGESSASMMKYAVGIAGVAVAAVVAWMVVT